MRSGEGGRASIDSTHSIGVVNDVAVMRRYAPTSVRSRGGGVPTHPGIRHNEAPQMAKQVATR